MTDGTSGPDNLVGTSGPDTINGLGGDDTINGGSRVTAVNSSYDVLDGGTGIDTMVLDCSSESAGVSLQTAGAPSFYVRSTSNHFIVDGYNFEKVKFTGGSGDDYIDTGAGGVVVNGGGGVDWWLANLGAVSSAITFTLGTTSSIAAAGLTSITNIERITLTTGSGNDTLTGGAYADNISSGLGNDTVDMKSRASQADSSVDTWDGGGGTDTLVVDATGETQSVNLAVAGAPSYYVRSTANTFNLDAYNVERVKFTGGSGDDFISTGAGGVVVKGAAGVDQWSADLSGVGTAITFNLATTSSIAAAGLTQISGIERISLATGAGADTITGGAYADTLNTGGGYDRVDMKTSASQADSSVDQLDAGAGTDTLVVDASADSTGVSLGAAGSPSFYVRSNANTFNFDAYNVEKVEFTGGSGNDFINTGSGGVIVKGGAGVDQWNADLSGIGSAIFFTLGTTSSIAAAGLTTITGIDRLVLSTGGGKDTITGGAFADSINTGGGNDRIDMKSRGSQADSSYDLLDAGAGTDTLVVDASAQTLSVSLGVGGAPSFFVRSTSGAFSIDAYSTEKVEFIGGSGNDSINSGANGVVIDGGGGDDRWFANFGASTAKIVYELGSTTSISAVGLDSIGGIEQLTITTGSGNDKVIGGAFADEISTGDGNDVIDAGTVASQPDSSIDVVNGGAGVDTLNVDVTGDTTGVTVGAGGAPSFFVRSVSGDINIDAYNVERVKLIGGAGADAATGGASADALNGGTGADTLNGGGGADLLVGGAGGDSLTGGVGSDTLNGGGDDDQLSGGDQADTLNGGAGRDTMEGGASGDVFLFNALSDSNKNSPDLIADLSNSDVIDLSAIDAKTTVGGDQAFTVVAAFTHAAGQAVLSFSAGVTTLSLDVDGDAKADSVIAMTGDHDTFSNFVL